MASDESIQIQFDAAVKVIENLPPDGSYQPSDDMMRVFYGYYKQATVGPCDVPKPSYWDTEGKARWEAWKALGDMTKEAAMMEYVQEMKLILEILPVTEEVSELLDALGSFYEFVDDDDDDEMATSAEFITAAKSATETNQNLVNGSVEIGDTGYEYGVETGDDGDDEEEEEQESKDENDSNDEMDVGLEEEGDQCVDLTRLIVDVTGWRGGSPVSNCSEENSTSSLINDTYSCLNTQEEEREPPCFQESPLKKPVCHSDRHLTNDNGVDPGQGHQTQALDTEVYRDLTEHPAPEEGAAVPRILLAEPEEGQARRQSPQGGDKAAQCGNQEPNPQCSPPYTEAHGTVQPDQSSVQIEGNSSLGTELRCHKEKDYTDTQRTRAVAVGNINKDIATALTRLQADMKDVLQRLNTLEALSTSQTKSLVDRKEQLTNENKKRTSWWPFSLSPVTVSLAIGWPLLVHWIVDFYFQKRRK